MSLVKIANALNRRSAATEIARMSKRAVDWKAAGNWAADNAHHAILPLASMGIGKLIHGRKFGLGHALGYAAGGALADYGAGKLAGGNWLQALIAKARGGGAKGQDAKQPQQQQQQQQDAAQEAAKQFYASQEEARVEGLWFGDIMPGEGFWKPEPDVNNPLSVLPFGGDPSIPLTKRLMNRLKKDSLLMPGNPNVK